MGLTAIDIDPHLPSLSISRIFQDQEGYMWFGSEQGITRFDAFHSVTFHLKDNYGKEVSEQRVTHIKEINNYLLLGSQNGLFLLDKRNFSVSPFPDRRVQSENINCILVDKYNSIWVGTAKGIYVYDANLNKKQSYLSGTAAGDLPPSTSISDIFEDQEGKIWVSVWEKGLLQLDKSSGHFRQYPKIGNRNNPFKMFQDNRGQRWLCTWSDGLFLFDPKNETNCYESIHIRNKRRQGGNEDLVYNILQDHTNHYIWVISFSGISAFEYAANGKIQEVDISKLVENTSNIFNDIYRDRTGYLWLAVEGQGISTIGFDKPALTHIEFDKIKRKYGIAPNLNTLYKDRDGQLWFNLIRLGLGKWVPDQNEFHTYSNAVFKDLISIRAVNCITEYEDRFWIGSSYESSINLFQKQGDALSFDRKVFLDQSGQQAAPPLFFFQDNDRNLWIATSRGVFIKKAHKQDVEFANPVEGSIVAIAQDEQQAIWIATQNHGIYKLHSKNSNESVLHLGRENKILKTNQIEAMDADKQGNLWIGTKDGRILAYHIQTGRLEEYTNSRLFQNNQILDIICLDQHIWISTSSNIYKIEPQRKEIIEYTSTDGLPISLFTKRCYTVDEKSKEIYFGGYNGIVAFPSSSFVPLYKSRVLVSDIKINNRSALLLQGSNKIDFEKKSIVLNPDEGNIEIDFSSLEYHHPQKIRYAYKLEGVDKDWIYAPRGRSFATYNNLGKGDYRFLIKATNLNNQWSNEITEISIRKKPAFYESNLAYLLYTLSAIALAYYIIRFSLTRLKLKNDLKIAQIEKEKTDELVQAKISYFTNISHDLLTPLTIISCLIDDIQMTTAQNLSQFERVRLNIDRLKRLLKQILDFRRLESQQMKIQVSEVNLPAFINKICTVYFSPLARRKGITFDVEQGNCIAEAYLDIDKLDKIIFNLLSNAFKYTPDNGHIQFDFRTIEKDKNHFLILTFKDNGIGISEEEINKIFIPFYNNKHNRQYESNGIGLALTKELVELHHGTITVDSIEGKGTCFTVCIPIDKHNYKKEDLQEYRDDMLDSATTASQIPTLSPSASSDTISLVSNINLLLVEDNEELLHTIQNVLSRNYQVTTAKNGQEALNILQDENTEIDIVISDIMMPVMDGLTLCRSIKSDPGINHTPVILLTAKNSIEDQIACYNVGADGYIGKPFDMKVLEARINSFIINKRTKQHNFKNNPQVNIPALDYTPVDEQFLSKMIAVIEEYLADERFDAIALGDKLGLSKSTLYRKTKGILNLSPSELIKNIRLKQAYKIMEKDHTVTVSEIAFAVGFSDPKYFSTCFKAEFGITPTNFQGKNKNEKG